MVMFSRARPVLHFTTEEFSFHIYNVKYMCFLLLFLLTKTERERERRYRRRKTRVGGEGGYYVHWNIRRRRMMFQCAGYTHSDTVKSNTFSLPPLSLSILSHFPTPWSSSSSSFSWYRVNLSCGIGISFKRKYYSWSVECKKVWM